MAKEVYRCKSNSELTSEILVVAKYTHEGNEVISKRLCGFYPEDTDKEVWANAGLMLIYQRIIRNARQVKEGHKKVTTGRGDVDLSAIENV